MTAPDETIPEPYVVLVDAPEIAARGNVLFPYAAKTLYANGEVPKEALTFKRVISIVRDAPRLNSICAQLATANVPTIECACADLTAIKTRDELVQWNKDGPIKTYVPPTAPLEKVDTKVLQFEPKQKRQQLAEVEGTVEIDGPVVFSESWFAAAFVAMHGDNWKCVRQWGKWFNWDGDTWSEDVTGSRMEPMRSMFDKAQNHPAAEKLLVPTRRGLFGRKNSMENALSLVGTDRKVRATPEIWDADPWVLGVPGGVVDLKTGKLVAAAREQYVTMRCRVAPKQGEPRLWLSKLEQWTGGDADIIGFLRRYLGYALTGDSREQCMAFFYGPAQAGKGTIMRTVSSIMGAGSDGPDSRSYHYETPISAFLESRGEKHSTELAAFYKKRLITAEEPNAGAKWDEGKLKWITGGSQITARFISRDNFSFTMSGKIIVAANHRPRLGSTDKSIRRRIMVVPFENPVSDEARDNALDDRLRDEWPQILDWLIQGCLEWQDCGLGVPERIAGATDSYLESEDTIGAWMEECCERHRDTLGSSLYRSYADWCESNGDNAFGRRRWSDALVEKGFQLRKGAAGARLVCGLNLKNSPV